MSEIDALFAIARPGSGSPPGLAGVRGLALDEITVDDAP